MPARIEHVLEKGQELKWCSKCKKFLPLSEFHTTNSRTWDGLFYNCVNCINTKRRNNPRRNALNVWNGMVDRVTSCKRYVDRGIQIKINKDDFIKWYVKRWFRGCVIDRIDNAGYYEFGNIHLITKAEHNKKQRQDILQEHKIVEPKGMKYCKNCDTLKSTKEFYQKQNRISPYNLLGLNSRCKECDRRKRKEYYKDSIG